MTIDLILHEQADAADLPAGEFTEWLAGMTLALEGGAESDVPCGTCDACCRSSYFIELKPADDAARRRIPAALLFDAPGAPTGYQVLGHDEAGRCPMLGNAGCTIYPDRPRTCRTFDCRIFAATGITEPAPDKADVAARAARWRFTYRDAASQARHRSLVLGTRALVDLQQHGPVPDLPRSVTQLALLAVQLHDHFHAMAPLLERRGEASVNAEVAARLLEAVRELTPAQ